MLTFPSSSICDSHKNQCVTAEVLAVVLHTGNKPVRKLIAGPFTMVCGDHTRYGRFLLQENLSSNEKYINKIKEEAKGSGPVPARSYRRGSHKA